MEYGETPPEKWSKSELLNRLSELQEIHADQPEKVLKLKSQDQLQQLISQLNKAKRKKTQLQEFLAELNLKANPSDTMYLMEQQAMTEIYRRVEPGDRTTWASASSAQKPMPNSLRMFHPMRTGL